MSTSTKLRLKKDKGIPLYVSLKNELESLFSSTPANTPLPGERELSERYGVSRTTVRKAKDLLSRDGVVHNVHGVGSFSKGAEVHSSDRSFALSNRQISFFDQVVSQGGIPTSKVLVQDIREADANIAERLGIKPGEKIFSLERLRYINGELYQIASCVIPLHLCPDLIKRDFAEDVSLYRVLEEYGIVPAYALKKIKIVKADDYDSAHLGIEPGSPVAVTYATTYDSSSSIIEYSVTRSLAYIFEVQMAICDNGFAKNLDKIFDINTEG
ncbi:GntR family transcriptional regulator [Olsenella sp. HMSC062G07]|uniref:GntR family transcriptional regulator n=1 Tax=Olsenella sp. HMSC062G07 TaxID=1739330 RepID=UPI0009F5CC3B|nr:GntR family transcriptional regulator [Olsenella sp. HMSC062G07]